MNNFLKLLTKKREMTDVNKRKEKKKRRNILDFPLSSFLPDLKELPFRNHHALLVSFVAYFTGIKIPHTFHPSSEAPFVYIPDRSGAIARRRHQMGAWRETNPTDLILIRIVTIIISCWPKCWHFFCEFISRKLLTEIFEMIRILLLVFCFGICDCIGNNNITRSVTMVELRIKYDKSFNLV